MPSYTNAIPYFDSRELPEPKYAYVVWLDVMGIGAAMARSLDITCNFVFKLHAAVLDSPHAEMQLYPVMDGVYAVASSQNVLRRFLAGVFSRLADAFVCELEMQHRFTVKASVAFGPLIHGRDLPRRANELLDENEDYRACILLGMPMIQAFYSEREAPPFGIHVHESARAFAPSGDKPFAYSWWRWWSRWPDLARELHSELGTYYDWCSKRAASIGYDQKSMDVPPPPGQLAFPLTIAEAERGGETTEQASPTPIRRPQTRTPRRSER